MADENMADKKRKILYREDIEYNSGAMTIERRLQMYEQHPDRSERSATLWHAWRQNKSWLIRLLELTLASFPSYSRHDASHAETVLHNIERILGEERIQELSATDCFAILHTVYIHDIGMAILADDREKIVESDGFVEMVDALSEGADRDLREAALQLKKHVYFKDSEEEIDYEGIEYHNKKKNLYREKLQAYYAVVQLLGEYQRKRHGEKAASSVKDWLLDGDKLRSEFSMSGIPMRIFFRIADCAGLHTDWEFDHIMALPAEENGYENDMLHPRFVAVLLQLGDALDIDNDRFHPFAQAFLGQLPMQSRAHYDKHLAIRMLKITPEEITLEADCNTLEAMRLIKNECDGIESILKSASYYWSSIAPRGFRGALPSFNSPRLLLKGIEIPLDLAKTRFQISQQKAFSLLQGENIYSGDFPFVRELLQNAIDSTKVQCYMDYKTSSKFRFADNRTGVMPPSIMNISKIINPVEYPIEIAIECCKLTEENIYEVIDITSVPEKDGEKEKYGIRFSIRDYGTGINTKTLRAISAVGTSYKERKKLLREIPDWLRPTGEFGIGLQSVFLVSDKFYCETYVRNGERYYIEFLTGANGEKGYINVQPKDAEEDLMAYGTKFEVFISHDQKKIRNEFMDSWAGYDPFANEYEKGKLQRDIIALTIQILLDIDGQLEDLLFPVYASVKFDLGEEHRQQLTQKLSKIVFSDVQMGGNYTEENLKQHVCWMYQHGKSNDADNNLQYFEIENGFCMVDLWKMQINIWLEDLSVNARIGVDRLLRDGFQVMRSPCDFYYKGILIKTGYIETSGNLLEYVDIQGGKRGSAGRKLIQLSRSGFTKEGELYVHTVIIPEIYARLQKALEVLAGLEFQEMSSEGQKVKMAEKIKYNMKRALGNSLFEWRRQVVGVSLYYNFYMRKYEKDGIAYISAKSKNEKEQWESVIRYVERAARGRGWRQSIQQMSETIENVQVMEVYTNLRDEDFIVLNERMISLADFYDRRNRFMVVSSRRAKEDNWINSLIWLKGSTRRIREQLEEEVKLQEPKLIELLEQKVTGDVGLTEKEKLLEQWAEFFLQRIGSIIENQEVRQSALVLGLMQSVSIGACFTDATGNLKLHILTSHAKSGVFYNNHAKYMLLKKMAERNRSTKAKRFAGNVWMGYEFLKLGAVQDDVCSLKEEYVGKNKAFMLIPCNGESARQLVQFAEEFDNSEWIDVNKLLREIAKKLDDCMTFDYHLCTSVYKELFEEHYSEHCRREQERLKKESFVERLRSGYQMLLQREFKKIPYESVGNMTEATLEEKTGSINQMNEHEKPDAVKETLENEPYENMGKMAEATSKGKIIRIINENFKQEKIEKFKEDIMREILENEQYVTSGEWLEDKSFAEMDSLLKEIVNYCQKWMEIWKHVEQLQWQQKLENIKNKYWVGSKERQNLIEWTAKQIQNEQAEVEEYYERIWGELEKAVKCHQKGNVIQQYQYRFIDWLED